MENKLYYNTVSPFLLSVLKRLMSAEEFADFRLVGGTALSLHIGHRESVDIDLFTDIEYGSVNWEAIDVFLRNNYSYVETNNYSVIGMGQAYYIGESKENCIKLDLFYTDEFIYEVLQIDDIRLASVEEVIAMKVEVISRGGRKKDFWDLHELLGDFTLEEMLSFHEKRYPYIHDRDLIIKNFTEFSDADNDFDPVCLKNKHWEIIKLDMGDFVEKGFT